MDSIQINVCRITHSFICFHSFVCFHFSVELLKSNRIQLQYHITFPFISILSHSLFIIIITYYIHNKWLIHIIEWIMILSNEYYFFFLSSIHGINLIISRNHSVPTTIYQSLCIPTNNNGIYYKLQSFTHRLVIPVLSINSIVPATQN